MGESIVGRARGAGFLEVFCHQLRDYAFNKHNRVDDSPYGGGMGMLLQAEPIALCFEDVCRQAGTRPHFIYMSPQGKVLTQERIKELAQYDNICILCGHYEGVDERVLDEYADEQISIGDYVLTGGELPALVLADAVCRLVPGVLADEECFEEESHYSGLLEYPHYTRPALWRGRETPEILLSGHHGNIENGAGSRQSCARQSSAPTCLKKRRLPTKKKDFWRRTSRKIDGYFLWSIIYCMSTTKISIVSG